MSGLGDLYQGDTDTALDAMALAPIPKPAPSAKSYWSIVSAIPRGIAGGAAKIGAAITEGVQQLSPSADELRRNPGRIAFSARDLGMVAQSTRDSERSLRPDPVTAGHAEHVLYGLSSVLTEAIGGIVIAGPVGGALAAGGAEGAATADDLARAGVDKTTRDRVGVLTGALTGIGTVIPMAGPTLKATAALWLAGGPGSFMAQQAITRGILERADYGKIAAQYDPLDLTGLGLSLLLPAPFALHGAGRVMGKARAADRIAADMAAGRAPDGAALPTAEAPKKPAASPEVVDAAMVHNITLQRDVHEAGTPTQATAHIPRADNLPPIDRAIENRFAKSLSDDYPVAVQAYAARPDSHGGKILNTDVARELSPDYLTDRTRSAAVHEPASWFIKKLYAENLARLKGEPIVFTSGGTGAGKTTAINNVPGAKALVDDAALVYDTNMNTLSSAVKKIDQALDAGVSRVNIVHVQRDPVDALVHGALPRAVRQEAEFGTGRTVPIVEHAKTHTGAAQVIQQLAERYKDDPRVAITVIDNTRWKGGSKESDLGFVRRFDYNGVEEKLHEANQKAYDVGRISRSIFEGTQGNVGERVRPVPGTDGGAQPEPQRGGAGPGGPEGANTAVITERGLTVPVKYRLIEADSLVTSHTNDLAANPAFPSELQPRDRTRAASAEQIARIEGNLKPELLGDSVKASDGAPIIGPGAVVESGNARTIALRRAYESGKAENYRAWLATNAQRFGLAPEQVAGLKNPVLVRERLGNIDRAEFARQANESPVAAMSPVEQARADASRMKDLSGLVANDDGTISMAKSGTWIRQFMQEVPPTERGALMQANGELSQAGQQRIRNAVFSKAYGDPEMLAALSESTNSNIKNILAGMLRAAPHVARMQDLIGSGARQPMDFAPELVQAVRELSAIKERGMTLEQFLKQGDMLSEGLPPGVSNLLIGLSENARAPKRISEMITRMVDSVDALGDPRQASMFEQAPTKNDVAADAVEGMRSLTDEQISGVESELSKPSADPLMRSVSDRVAQVAQTNADMVIGKDAAGRDVTVADELERIRREAFEGTDTELGAADANLLTIAADCALSMGAT